MSDPVLGHYRPWLEDVRRYRPYQLEDRVEQLFHEKSMTAYTAWNRQFDATIANLRFKVSGKTLAIEPTLNFMQDRDGKKRKDGRAGARAYVQGQCGAVRADHNTLAKDKEISDRWRGFADIADERHLSNRVEREVVDALVAAVRAAYPQLSHRYYALKAKWFGKKRLPHWDRNAPLPQVPHAHRRLGRGQGYGADRLWRVLAENGGRSPSDFLPSAGSTRRCGRARRRARSRIRRRRRRILMCCSTTRASRAT